MRPEKWTPSYAGACSRMDFLLKREQIGLEAKKTRAGTLEPLMSYVECATANGKSVYHVNGGGYTDYQSFL